jgi:hypothetical protein
MAVFIEKPPDTSSNCYETVKNASIFIKLGTTVDWTIAFVTGCSNLNFLLQCTMATVYFALIFSIKTDWNYSIE